MLLYACTVVGNGSQLHQAPALLALSSRQELRTSAGSCLRTKPARPAPCDANRPCVCFLPPAHCHHAPQKSHSPDPTDCTQWNVRAVAAVNHALILFLQQQHAAALSVLEPLFEDVDLLQNGTALCTCVLLLEVYLDSMQLPKAVQVLEYLQGLSGPRAPEALCSSDAPTPGDAAGSSTQQAAPEKSHPQQDRKDGGPVGPAGGAAAGAGGQQEAGAGAGAGRHVALSEALPVVSKTRSSFMQEVGVGKLAGRLSLHYH